jgi:glucose-6-phosphate 1-dehydrogenase
VSSTEVLVELRQPPKIIFDHCTDLPACNYFKFQLSPNVLISLGARAKLAGEAMTGEAVELIAKHQAKDEMTAYERLLGDAMRGDPALFAREDSVEESWRVVGPALDNAAPVHEYAQGEWGPGEADALIQPDGGWHNPGKSAG